MKKKKKAGWRAIRFRSLATKITTANLRWKEERNFRETRVMRQDYILFSKLSQKYTKTGGKKKARECSLGFHLSPVAGPTA